MTPIVLKLKELRERAGLSQVELAKAAGIRQAWISEAEGGKLKTVDLAKIERIAAVLKVADPSTLFAHRKGRK